MLFATGPLNAQTLQVSEDRPVTIGLEDRVLVYPHLAVHPTDSRRLLGAVWVSGPAASHEERVAADTCSVILSTDGGATWDRRDFPHRGCGDPWVAFAMDGRAVFTSMVTHPEAPDRDDTVVVHHSPDGGVTWLERPANLGVGHDHQFTAADGSSPDRAGWLYLVSSRESRAENAVWRASVFVARSRDGGRGFDPPVHVRPNNLMIKAEGAVVLSDGTLIVAYVEPTTAPANFRYLPQRRAWVVRSHDGGQTFSIPLFVNDACGPASTAPGQRFSLSAFAAAPHRGPHKDRLYFACNITGGGGVLLNYSTDRGETWSEPRPVHAAPIDPSVRRRLMAVAVNGDGTLGVLWSDFRHSDGSCYDAYFTASVDGGETFLPEQRVSTVSSCPDPAVMGGSVPWSDGGAHWGMAADAEGNFGLLWSDARNGRFQLRSATAVVSGGESADRR